ncbi:Kynurenine formamidase [Clostridium cavendishii DSM 21758]|uniref:Kynurenine formamidase n=1 Tax=Clostridium cavendishii DSM 21758 TaxID=1121302 RepID=A0A1M6R644_9CLOT|nr:cyclase family protein [Clostridium cavendishii]SHK27959.1 Kynurenine formamidase [Clostridium cavendishii DSM 21758]
MKIDLTLEISKEILSSSLKKAINEDKAFGALGHIGTHFDIMDKNFPLDYINRSGKIFNVSHIRNSEISLNDINLNEIKENHFIIFYTGYLKEKGYGTTEYLNNHPELSIELIDYLIDKKVSLIGIDSPGIKKGSKHRYVDQYCADRNVFIVENINNLDLLWSNAKDNSFTMYTFPLNIKGTTGLTSRVIAEL